MLSVLSIFLLLTVSGTLLLRATTFYKNNFVLFASGATLGTCIYIFTLNTISKILPGHPDIILSTFFMLLLVVVLIVKYPLKISLHYNTTSILALLVVISAIYFSSNKMITHLPAGDSNMQWAYAASFTRGNNPLMTPWQPNFLANYHLGAYFLEGALQFFSNYQYVAIHALVNILFFVEGFSLTIFILWEKKYFIKNFWLILAGLTLFLSYGITIIGYPNNILAVLQQFDKVLRNLVDLSPALQPRGAAGAALVNLDSLSLLPARSLSIAMALLTLNYFIIDWKSNKAKIILTTITLSALALVEESMFLPVFLTIVLIFIFSLSPINPILELKKVRKTLFIIIFLTALITILQGGFVTTNLLQHKNPSFVLTLPIEGGHFFGKLGRITSNYYSTTLGIYKWFIPSPLLLLIPGFLYGLFKKKRFLIYITFFALLSFCVYLSVEYKYEPSNNIRFYNFGFIASGLCFSYFLFLYFSKQSTKKNIILLTIFILMVGIPTIIPELIIQIKKIEKGHKASISSWMLIKNTPSSPLKQIALWASDNLPPNSRLLSLDSETPSPAKLLEFEFQGIYTTYGPNDYRVLSQEPGVEFNDLTLSLNPSLLKLTKTDYIFVESKSKVYQQLPKIRKDQLNNPLYFKALIYIPEIDNQNYSALYQVKSEFLNSPDIEEGTLTYLRKLIPKNSSVYIGGYPRINFWYRMALSLALKNHDVIINTSQTRYQAIETTINGRVGNETDKYTFYLIGPDEKPNFPSELIWSNIYASAWKRE